MAHPGFSRVNSFMVIDAPYLLIAPVPSMLLSP